MSGPARQGAFSEKVGAEVGVSFRFARQGDVPSAEKWFRAARSWAAQDLGPLAPVCVLGLAALTLAGFMGAIPDRVTYNTLPGTASLAGF